MTPVYDIENINPGTACTEALPLRRIYRLEPVAALALIVPFPVALAIGIAVAILSGRSSLIRYRRVGWREVPLPMLEFRTIWENVVPGRYSTLVEDISDSVPAAKQRSVPRVVSFAPICRRYSLDEIPQLYGVAHGQMSFVGRVPLKATNSISAMVHI